MINNRKHPRLQKQKGSPLYQQVAEALRQRIQARKLNESDRLPTTKALSQEFQVSPLTARQALKVLEKQGLVSMRTGRGIFVLSGKKEQTHLAVIVPTLGNQMSGDISRGMRRAIDGRGISLTFVDYHSEPDFEKECIERLRSDSFDGAIFFPTLHPQTILPALELVTSGFPTVFVDRMIEGVPCSLITSDNFGMGKLAAEHLASLGVKRPACVMTEISSTLQRLNGFRVGLNNANIVLPEDRVLMAPVSGDTEGELTTKLLAQKEPPDAIFYHNDYEALTGLKVIQQRGLTIPSDIKILGCDDIEAAHLAVPPLSSVKQNFPEVGARALEMVLKLINLPKEDRFTMRHEIIGVELVVRESTAG